MGKQKALAVEVDESEVQRAAAFQYYARFENIDATQNRYRAYLYLWQPDLWGRGGLIRSWGRLGSLGRLLVTHYPDRSRSAPRRRVTAANPGGLSMWSWS
jgi:hypothetical protein